MPKLNEGKKGHFCILEPNKINAQYTKQVFAQLPFDAALFAERRIEQGMVVAYDVAEGKVRPVLDADETAVVGIVYNEYIMEDEKKQQDYHFYVNEDTYPRVLALTVGDTFTTDAVVAGGATADGTPYTVKAADKGLISAGTGGPVEFKLVKVDVSYCDETAKAYKFVVTKA